MPVFFPAKKKSAPWSRQQTFKGIWFQGSNDYDDGLEEETTVTILPDKKWIKSLTKEELEWFKDNLIPFEDLEDKKVVCSACFKQGNHKQKVKSIFEDSFWYNIWIKIE